MNNIKISAEVHDRVFRMVYAAGMVQIVGEQEQVFPMTEDEFVEALRDKTKRPIGAASIRVTDSGYDEINRLAHSLYDGYVKVGGTGTFKDFLNNSIFTVMPPGTPAFEVLVYLKAHEEFVKTELKDALDEAWDNDGNETVH